VLQRGEKANKKVKYDAEINKFVDKPSKGSDSTKAVKSMTKTQLYKQIDTIPEAQARKILAKLLDEVPAFEQVLKAELVSDARNQDNGPKIYDVRRETLLPPRSSINSFHLYSQANMDVLEWQGAYDVTSPDLVELGPDYGVGRAFTLEMYRFSTNSHLWAAFDFGVVSGIMRSKTTPPTAIDAKVSYQWRGYESGENTMLYGKDNKGDMTLLQNGNQYLQTLVPEEALWQLSTEAWGVIFRNSNLYVLQHSSGNRDADVCLIIRF